MVRKEMVYNTTQGQFAERDVRRTLSLATDPTLEPVGKVPVRRTLFGRLKPTGPIESLREKEGER